MDTHFQNIPVYVMTVGGARGVGRGVSRCVTRAVANGRAGDHLTTRRTLSLTNFFVNISSMRNYFRKSKRFLKEGVREGTLRLLGRIFDELYPTHIIHFFFFCMTVNL